MSKKDLFHRLVQYSNRLIPTYVKHHHHQQYRYQQHLNYHYLSKTIRYNINYLDSTLKDPLPSLERHHIHTNHYTGPNLSSMDSPIPRGNEISSELRDRAHKLCCEHLGGAWNDITPDDMSITPITGGLSNILYCCSLPESKMTQEDEPNQALLRLYGDHSRNCDTAQQVQIFELLSSKDLGPKLYGHFDDGRLEEFLPAQSLTNDELRDPDISSIIARKLARVHSLDVPNMSKENNWVLARFAEWPEFINNHRRSPSDSTLIQDSTLKIANQLLAIDFEQEINFVRKIIDDIQSPLVFSHNDLHSGNILMAKPTRSRSVLEKRIVLIDFEYSGYNYRAYDIANHFCEWCFEYDTIEYPYFVSCEDRFPSVEIQRKFIRNYLAANIRHHDHNNQNGFSVSEQHQVDKILQEIKCFCLAAHLVWTLWCIKSAYTSNIKFGFWEHAWSRWQLYSNLKRSI